MVSRIALLVLFLFVIGSIKAQDGEVTNQIFEGNTLLDTQVFDEAEMAFRKALSKSPERTEALYNLGNTHFNEQDYEEAKQRYFQTQKFADNNSSKHHAFHNMGNVFMKQKDYAKAVETYKNALRNNPQDEETRYNYAMAKELLEKEQQQQDNQDQNQENKDQKNQEDQDNQENKDQDKESDKDQDSKENNDDSGREDNEDKKGEGDQQKDNQPKEENDKKQNQQPQQPRQKELSPEQVKSLLEAMNNQEKEVQDKVNAEKAQGTPLRGTKDW